MQQTEKYKFNLIETSDDFSPTPLNKNAETAERELARVEAQAAAKSELTAHTADTASHAFVKLGHLRLSDGRSGTVIASNVAGYSMFMINVNVAASVAKPFIFAINNVTLLSNGSNTVDKEYQATLLVYPLGTGTTVRGTFHRRGAALIDWKTFNDSLTWGGDFTLGFTGCDVETRVTVYGLKV